MVLELYSKETLLVQKVIELLRGIQLENNTLKLKYPALRDLLAGSFFQYWEEYDGRPASEIVDEAIEGTSKTEQIKAVDELNKIFNLLKNVGQLEEIIGYDIGCNYNSEDDGISHVEWLVDLKHKLIGSNK